MDIRVLLSRAAGRFFVKLLIGGRRRAANVFYYACKDFLDFFFKRKEPIQVIKNF